MILRRVIIFLSVLLVCMWTSAADEIQTLRADAEKGNPQSMFRLGSRYFYGDGSVKRNFTLAAYWFQRSARAGYVDGMFNYAVCLDRGFGVKQNRYEAYQWYGKASEAGSKHAKFNMAQMLFSGVPEEKEKQIKGVAASPGLALHYLQELAKERFEPAEILLAEILLERKSAPPMGVKDLKELIGQAAEILLRLAKKEKPDPKVLRMLADCKYAGLGMKEDHGEMIRLLQRAVRLGDGEAAGKLAHCYEYGRGIPADEKKAFEFYKLGAVRGNPMSQFKYAEFLILGRPEGNEPDIQAALKWYESAAKARNPQAMFRMGVFYLDGMGPIGKDPQKAAKFFYDSAKMGYAQAQYNLASLFSEGRGVMKDDAAALFWYLQAAKQGDTASARTIGIFYLEGRGVSRSISKAELWLKKAAAAGDPEAGRLLRTRFR